MEHTKLDGFISGGTSTILLNLPLSLQGPPEAPPGGGEEEEGEEEEEEEEEEELEKEVGDLDVLLRREREREKKRKTASSQVRTCV